MKTISLKIDEGLDRWLEAEAKRLGRSKSALAREALEQRKAGGTGPSVHDIMKDICGIVRKAPRDLSTNKKYLRDFGREPRPA